MKKIRTIRAAFAAVFLLTTGGLALAQQPATSAAPTVHAHAAADVAAAEPRLIMLDDLKARLASGTKLVIVDVRGGTLAEMATGAVHVPPDKLEAWAKDVAKDTLVVAYCACGSEGSSKAAVRKLQELGFTNAFALKGGIQGWKAAGMPVEAVNP